MPVPEVAADDHCLALRVSHAVRNRPRGLSVREDSLSFIQPPSCAALVTFAAASIHPQSPKAPNSTCDSIPKTHTNIGLCADPTPPFSLVPRLRAAFPSAHPSRTALASRRASQSLSAPYSALTHDVSPRPPAKNPGELVNYLFLRISDPPHPPGPLENCAVALSLIFCSHRVSCRPTATELQFTHRYWSVPGAARIASCQ
ncbi:hypothetical protein C8R45DRAFT_1131930 [Mycena sanguinolenta]|nr:hypothetical protein C8R45DRAFT_1131930 [Mycena sanguinolenta]